jgi:Zn finger protein HypA/HybF involved in hydrogenase expression
MEEKCWNCRDSFEPQIKQDGDDLVAFCPKCSTRHIYIETEQKKLVISRAITNEDKIIRHPYNTPS